MKMKIIFLMLCMCMRLSVASDLGFDMDSPINWQRNPQQVTQKLFEFSVFIQQKQVSIAPSVYPKDNSVLKKDLKKYEQINDTFSEVMKKLDSTQALLITTDLYFIKTSLQRLEYEGGRNAFSSWCFLYKERYFQERKRLLEILAIFCSHAVALKAQTSLTFKVPGYHVIQDPAVSSLPLYPDNPPP